MGKMRDIDPEKLAAMGGMKIDEVQFAFERHHIGDHAYDVEDLGQDLKTLEQLEAGGLMPRP